MGVTRYVNLAFVVTGLLLWRILGEFYTWTFSIVGLGFNRQIIGHDFRVADLLGLVTAALITLYIRRHEQFSTFTMEAGNELAKVTWPTWSETRLSTIVVIITTFIISLILGGFDYLWAALSSLVYDV